MEVKNKFFKRLLIFAIAATMCMAILAVFPSVNADCPSGMISYWKLDETSAGSVVDSVGSYPGTNNGATINQPGQVYTSYYFDSSDTIDCGIMIGFLIKY